MAKISDLDSLLSNTQPKASQSFENLPSGTYQAKIASAVLTKGKESGKDQINYKLKIISGEHKGTTIRKYSSLGNEELVSFALGDLCTKLGQSRPKSKENLIAILDSITDSLVEMYITAPGDNGRQNVYFNRLLDSADEATESKTSDDDDDDDAETKPTKKTADEDTDDDDEKPTKKPAKADDDDDDDDAPVLTIAFKESSIDDALKPKLESRAVKLGLDVDDYEDDYVGLLKAMAAKKKIVGTFKSAQVLYSEIKSA